MTFLAPWFLAGAALTAAGVIALHFLAFQRPRPSVLPTARFLPDRPARAASPARRPRDLLLLALRLLLVLLVGAAFARPVVAPRRRPVARVVALDRSRAVGDEAAARDSARRYLGEGDALVAFDSAARAVTGAAADSLLGAAPGGRTAPRGSLSAALVAALRAAPALRERADSVELVVVSPVAVEERDEATAPLRALWRGRARLVRVAAVMDTAPRSIALAVRAPAGDPVLAAASLVRPLADSARVRVVRGAPGAADSAWARAGGALVHWPAAGDRPPWPRLRADSSGAVVTGAGSVVAVFDRRWAAPAGGAFLWWVDGGAAATEVPHGAGCLRSVAVAVPEVGDVTLTPAFRRLVDAVAVPCGGARDVRPDADVRWLSGTGALYAPPPPDANGGARLARWLFAAALAVAVLELALRRGEGRA